MAWQQPETGRSSDDASSPEEFPVHGLTTAEALLVWGIRHWVACLKAKTDPIPLLTAGFGSGGVAEAVRSLEGLLLLTLDTATSPRDVRCTRCATVGGGERDLLAAVAFAQAHRSAEALDTLRGWLPPASARLAQDLVAEIAATLHDRKLIVPVRGEYRSWRYRGDHPDIRVAVPASLTVH